ncbi:MAG: response regulator transcription factor [Microbacteriaceae bacterium]
MGTADSIDAAPLRVALVDDHEIVRVGIAELLAAHPSVRVVASTSTVSELFALDARPQLVVLDLRLSDGSTPGENVAAIRDHGLDALVLTGGDDPRLVRSAARAGVLGVIRKAAPASEIVEALLRAGSGETVATTDWAAALDADTDFADARLSTRERQILALYASGEKAQAVASKTGLSRDTVSNYISRIRVKYANVGRPAYTKVDLHRRAVEDGLMSEG